MEVEMDGKQQEQQPESERTVFIPAEEIQTVEDVLDKMQQAQHEFRKVAEGMKSVEN
jgi:hypothetical protein